MIIVVCLCVLLALIFIIEFNKLTRLKNKIKQSKSSIDVYLTKRFDLIPNLVECVKAYAKHESSVFEKISELRNSYAKDKNLEKGQETYNEFNKILAIGESYPELKANDQFLNLQKELSKIEDDLSAARRLYNGDVTLYNSTCEAFPNSIFAKIFGFKEEKLFEIENYKKENVRIDL